MYKVSSLLLQATAMETKTTCYTEKPVVLIKHPRCYQGTKRYSDNTEGVKLTPVQHHRLCSVVMFVSRWKDSESVTEHNGRMDILQCTDWSQERALRITSIKSSFNRESYTIRGSSICVETKGQILQRRTWLIHGPYTISTRCLLHTR